MENMVWYFPNLFVLGKDGWGISFFFLDQVYLKLWPKKIEISYKKDFFFFYFKLLIIWMNIFWKYYKLSFLIIRFSGHTNSIFVIETFLFFFRWKIKKSFDKKKAIVAPRIWRLEKNKKKNNNQHRL